MNGSFVRILTKCFLPLSWQGVGHDPSFLTRYKEFHWVLGHLMEGTETTMEIVACVQRCQAYSQSQEEKQ